MKLDFPNHLSRNDLQEILARSSSAVVEEKVSELKDLITHEKKLLKARKSNVEPITYAEAVNEFKTLKHDGELITPNIIDFLEQKF